MADDPVPSLQAFCETHRIRRLEPDEIRELLADGEDPSWVAAQAAEDRPELVAPLTQLLEAVAPQVRSAAPDEDGPGPVGPEEQAEELDSDDLPAHLAEMATVLPPGVDLKQLGQVLSSPSGKLLADFGTFCQDRGAESPDEEQLYAYHEEWLQTPRTSLGGRRPAEVLDGGRLLPARVSTFRRDQPKVGRNDPCPCGSGRKFKRCCGQAGG